MVDGNALTGDGDGPDTRGFLRVLCHEFGTPIASVRALAKALARRTPLSAEQRVEAIRLIADHADHLDAMLDAVRVVAEHLPTSGATPPVTTALSDLVAGATHAAGLDRLDVHIAPVVATVRLDVASVRRIITNLLANARTHGAEPISLDARARGHGLVLVIIDHGKGMPPGVAADAFRSQTPAADGPHGLGLWIVTQLVTMLGGAVRAEPNQPTGTRVEVVLPLPG